MDALVADIKGAMKGRIEQLDLDERPHQGQGPGEAVEVQRDDRLSRNLARLFGPGDQAGDLYGNVERANAFEWRRTSTG
jgi:hypothetical protein